MTPAIEQRERAHLNRVENRHAHDRRAVRVWLFGGLSSLMPVRPAIIDAPRGASVDWVITELGRRIGPQFIERVLRTPDRTLGVCRVFLDGMPASLDDRLPLRDDASDLELIVLSAIEGG